MRFFLCITLLLAINNILAKDCQKINNNLFECEYECCLVDKYRCVTEGQVSGKCFLNYRINFLLILPSLLLFALLVIIILNCFYSEKNPNESEIPIIKSNDMLRNIEFHTDADRLLNKMKNTILLEDFSDRKSFENKVYAYMLNYNSSNVIMINSLLISIPAFISVIFNEDLFMLMTMLLLQLIGLLFYVFSTYHKVFSDKFLLLCGTVFLLGSFIPIIYSLISISYDSSRILSRLLGQWMIILFTGVAYLVNYCTFKIIFANNEEKNILYVDYITKSSTRVGDYVYHETQKITLSINYPQNLVN